ncbi:MAG: cupin domain-containing protein [Pseudomonadota bacterium]
MKQMMKAVAPLAVAVAWLTFSTGSVADHAAKPGVKFYSKADLAGEVFERDGVIDEKETIDGEVWTAKDFSIFTSNDEVLDMGFYRSDAVRAPVDSYSVDEFMVFLKGGVDLIADDGSVTKVRAGDAVFIEKGWKGIWDTQGYEKIYVIYSTD